MDRQNSQSRSGKGAKATLTLSVIFSLLAALAVSFYVMFYLAFVEGKIGSLDGNTDLGEGIGMALGLVFSLICGGATAVASAIGIGTSAGAIKLGEGRIKTAAKVLLAVNIVFVSVVGISLLVAFIVA